MADFSIKAIDAVVGEARFSGFTSNDEEHPLRLKRRLALRNGPQWLWDEPLDASAQPALGVVENIAAQALEAGRFARPNAIGAFHAAVANRYRAVPYPTIEELREIRRAPRCSARLRGVTVQFDHAWRGEALTAYGSPMRPDIRLGGRTEAPDLPPALHRAIRYAHRLTYVHVGAGLLDAVAQFGHHVPTLEGALTSIELELGFLTEA